LKLFYRKDYFLFNCKYSQREHPKSNGFSFDYESKLWYTSDPMKAINLRQYATDELEKKFQQYDKYLESQVAGSSKESADIEIPKPDNGMDYFPFQKAGIEFMWNQKNVLQGDQMGLGKTIQAIGLFNMIDDFKSAVIICPNTLKRNWKNEIEEWLIHDVPVRICDSVDFEFGDGISIINYEAFRNNTTRGSDKYTAPKRGGKYNNTEKIIRRIKKIKNIDCLVMDESHRIKNWSSNTTRNIFKIRKYFDRKVLMTGTPIMNRPEELWTTIKFLGFKDKFGGTKKKFGFRYCDLKMSHWGWDYSGSSNLKELQIKMRSNFMVRRTRDQVLSELPKKFRKPVKVEISETYKQHLEEFSQVVKDITAFSASDMEMESNVLKGLKVDQIEDIAEIRKIVGQAKIIPVYEYTKEILEAGEKVVLFGHHTSVLEAYKRKFKNYNPAFITGKVKQDDRQTEVEKFQEDESCRIIILNMAVGSVGLTLTRAHNTVFAELDYVPQIMNQAEDRTNRIGAKHPSTNHYILANGTLDAMIGEKIIIKQDIFDRAIETKSL